MSKHKTIGTGSEKGTFKLGDKHPWLEGRAFAQYVMQDGNCYESWTTAEKLEERRIAAIERCKIRQLAKRKNVKSHQTMLPRGHFKRGDKHPWQASLIFNIYRGESEQWVSKDKMDKKTLQRARYRHSKRGTSIESESRQIDQLHLLRQRLSDCLGIEFHLDHTVPISKGGTHTLDNLEVVPARWNECKSNLHCDRWIK